MLVIKRLKNAKKLQSNLVAPKNQAKKPLIKTFDKYIIKKFLGSYFFSIILLLVIVTMFDINEKLDAILEAPLYDTVFKYFMNFLPYFANQFSPLFTFIAVIFFTSKMADNSEIIAILSSGISYRRFLVPYLVSALVIACLSFVLSAYIIPPANIKRIEYTNKYVKNKKVEYGTNIQLEVADGIIAYISRFDNTTKTGYKFSMEEFDGKEIKSRLTAQIIKYDTLYHWHLNDYVIRSFNGYRETIKKGHSIDTVIEIEPRDFIISSEDQETLTINELSDYIDRQKERGVANIKGFEIEYHTRYAMMAAAFILTLIGMSLSSRKVKGGMGVNVGFGLVLSFTYILFMTITSTFAVKGYTSSFVAMWIPNIIYLIIGLVLYRKASR